MKLLLHISDSLYVPAKTQVPPLRREARLRLIA